MKTNNTNTNPTTCTVTTKKTKCNGAKFKGYLYFVEVTDGQNTASFINDGKASITLADFTSATNKHGSKYCMNKGNNVLYQLPRFGKSSENEQQKAEIMEFIKGVLHIGVKFGDGVLTYTA